jgi:hypothetical protein
MPGDLRTRYRGLAAPVPRGEESPGVFSTLQVFAGSRS